MAFVLVVVDYINKRSFRWQLPLNSDTSERRSYITDRRAKEEGDYNGKVLTRGDQGAIKLVFHTEEEEG